MKKDPEITWSLMHPTALDPVYFRRVVREAAAGGFRVDSFEVCARCHSPLGGLDGLLPAAATAGLDVDRAAIDANIARLREILAASHDSGRPLYYWHREVTTAPGTLRLHPELLDENGEFDLLGVPFERLLRAKIAGAFEAVPELDGIVLTLTEAEYSVLHNSRPEKYPPAEVVRRISEIFCDELEGRGKRFILRSFGSIDADYRSILAGAELLAAEGRRFEVETKITPFDFDPFLPENPYLVHTGGLALGAEFDVLGEFLGAGLLPAEDVDGTIRRVAAARRAGVDRYAIRLDRGGRTIFDTHVANLEACMAAIADPELTAEAFRVAAARRRRTPEVGRALDALARRGFEAVLRTHFVRGNVIFHVNPPGRTLGILKASGFFAFFSEKVPLRHLAGVWSILAGDSTGTRAELLAEKEEAIALAAGGVAEVERLRPQLPADEYGRLRRRWRTLLGAAESVAAFCRAVAAYFDDQEAEREEHPRLAAAMEAAARTFARFGADAGSDAPAYALPLADAVKLLPEEFAAEFTARHDPRWRGAEDLVIPGALTDEWRCGHAMHAGNTRIADGVPCRAAGNRLFPNGSLTLELHGDPAVPAPKRLLLTGRGCAAVAVDGIAAGEFALADEAAALPLPPGRSWSVTITRAGGGDYPEIRAAAVTAEQPQG